LKIRIYYLKKSILALSKVGFQESLELNEEEPVMCLLLLESGKNLVFICYALICPLIRRIMHLCSNSYLDDPKCCKLFILDTLGALEIVREN